jgi:hypothetical protein
MFIYARFFCPEKYSTPRRPRFLPYSRYTVDVYDEHQGVTFLIFCLLDVPARGVLTTHGRTQTLHYVIVHIYIRTCISVV